MPRSKHGHTAAATPAKDSAKQRLVDAERIYDVPDRDDVTKANNDLRDKSREKPKDSTDAVVDVNVRKPI